MKKLFYYFLKKYSNTEKGRLEIQSILNEQVENEYSEQTKYGNVYNSFIEFIISNNFIIELVNENDLTSLNILKNGISDNFEQGIYFIKNEKIKKMRRLKIRKIKKL